MPNKLSSITTLVLLLADFSCGLAVDTWPSFHNGGNTSVDASDLPVVWNPAEGITWNVELPGYGQSSPIVWQGRVYLTAVDGEEKESSLVLAFCAETGQALWKREFSATVTEKTSYMVSRAAPTPLVDSQGLYVLFESGDLHALAHDGTPRWHIPLFDSDGHSFENSHGYGASPAQTEDAIILLVDHRGPSYLLALSKETGETLWRTERSSRSSWTSPHVARIGDDVQVIVSSSGSVDGYDATTGESLWSHQGISGNVIPSATVCGSKVFVGASTSRDDISSGPAAASNCCLRVTPGCEGGYELLWQAEKAVCYYASPLVHRGYAYYLNSVGVLYCLDAATGQQVYAERIGSPCWAQPIAAGDLLFFFGKDGRTSVVRAGPTFERIGTNRLWASDDPPLPTRSYEYEPDGPTDPRPRQARGEYLDPIVYAVSAVDGAFFVRLGTHLYCIRGNR